MWGCSLNGGAGDGRENLRRVWSGQRANSARLHTMAMIPIANGPGAFEQHQEHGKTDEFKPQGSPPFLQAFPSRYPPFHELDQDRGCRQHRRCQVRCRICAHDALRVLTIDQQLLPRQEGRVRLQGSEGGSRLQDPRDLGQGHPPPRYIRPTRDIRTMSRAKQC